MEERMKIISGNIRTIVEMRSINTPRGNGIIEKEKGGIDAKMKEIGKGIKRNRTPENAPESQSKKPKKPKKVKRQNIKPT